MREEQKRFSCPSSSKDLFQLKTNMAQNPKIATNTLVNEGMQDPLIVRFCRKKFQCVMTIILCIILTIQFMKSLFTNQPELTKELLKLFLNEFKHATNDTLNFDHTYTVD